MVPTENWRVGRQERPVRLFFVLSIAVAFAALLYPSFLGSSFLEAGVDPAIYVSLFLAICWLGLFVVGIFKFRTRGLWLLIGLPVAAYWPITFFVFAGTGTK
jgi:hypothetical protein